MMKKIIAFLACVLLMTACSKDSTISHDYRCFFVFDTSLHPLPCQLTGIVGNNGLFMKVEMSTGRVWSTCIPRATMTMLSTT